MIPNVLISILASALPAIIEPLVKAPPPVTEQAARHMAEAAARRAAETVAAAPELQPKAWWASKGIVGPIIAMLSMALTFFGAPALAGPEQAQLVDQVINAVGAVGVLAGSILGIVGRLRAVRPIGG